MHRILITGGSGFIGTNLLIYLLKKGHQVVNIDKSPPRNPELNDSWKKCDIRDLELFRHCCKEFDPEYVIHLAARTDLNGHSLNDYSSNTIGTENVVRVLNELRHLKRAIITSSMLVCRLGYHGQGPDDYAPPNAYGESKVQTEIITKKDAKFDWVITRPTSIWGPWFGSPYKDFFDMVIADKFLISPKFGLKTYGFVDNAITQIEALMTDDKARGNVFYLGDYKVYDIAEWAVEISDLIGSKRPISIPHFVFILAALFGDLLSHLRIPFPMTTFRLKNMTTNNVVDLRNVEEVIPYLSIDRKIGVKLTLDWMKVSNKIKQEQKINKK